MVLCTTCVPCFADPRSEAAQRLLQAEKRRAAQDTRRAAVDRTLRDAQAEGEHLAEQRVKATAALRTTEEGVVDAAATLTRAQEELGRAETALALRAAAFSALVPLMLRMSRYPAETVIAIPLPPDQAVEGLLLARGVTAALNHEAVALRDAAQRAADLKTQTGREAAILTARRRTQRVEAAALDRDVAAAQARISDAEAKAEAAAARAAALAARAQTLRDAIAAMDAGRAGEADKAAHEAEQADQQQQPDAARAARVRIAALGRPSLRAATGRMLAPVAGRVVKKFGSPESDGPATGITYGVAPSAFVASPCAGSVGFAAPFRSYGKLVIVECAGGYDWVLAGMEKIVARPGSAVRAGEPIGQMPDFNPGNTDIVGSRPGLYVELRSHGEPVDPLPFLNARG